jgi:ATP dependent DNA ligase domain
MDINEYIESRRHSIKRIPSEIRERWNNRIVKNSWHLQGVDGALQYLGSYGNGISATKVINLAICAESEGYPEVALGFWSKAFDLETGKTPPTERQARHRKPPSSLPKTPVEVSSTTIPEWKTRIFVPELPSHLQPGSIVTMQAIDAPFDRDYYINSPDYWGQAKRDGQRRVIIATKGKIYYQSRSTKPKGQPTIEINSLLLDAANKLGTFVLDGELYYRSVTGSEHRTAPQADAINIAQGKTDTPTIAVFAIFKALWLSEQDLTTATEGDRISVGEEIGRYLASDFFEVLPTARTQEEKAALAAKQESEGREGEIWVQKNCAYVGGKDTRNGTMVRTKYSLELDLIITNLSLTKAAGRPFGSIQVAQEINGKLVSMGSVGTGFCQAEMEKIAHSHANNPGKVKITVRSQGLTETGKLWHGRFVGLCEDLL